MIRVGGEPAPGAAGEDVEFCGLLYPDGDEISKHMAARLQAEPFYQHDKLQQALALVPHRRGAIDCGAWVGGWSRELAKHFERVVTIEANAGNARCARKNLAACGNVEVVHVAICDRNGEGIACKEENGGNVGSRVIAIGDTSSAFAVAMRTIDDLPQVQALPAIDYIKIHVNGMEFRALRGAAATIAKHRPLLTIVLKPAIEDYGDTADAARAMLTGMMGYRQAGGERPYEIWAPT